MQTPPDDFCLLATLQTVLHVNRLDLAREVLHLAPCNAVDLAIEALKCIQTSAQLDDAALGALIEVNR